MATSNTAIANRALQKLGEERIESLSQDAPNARSMAAVLEPIRDALQRKYVWSFCIKRASIAADADQTEWGDLNRYSLPNDFLRLIRDDETGFAVNWKIEGLYIVTPDSAPLDIKYVAKIEDPNYFDTLFIEAMAAKMAYEACQEITGSTSKQDRCERDFTVAVSEAMRIGAMEKPSEEPPEDDWNLSRL